jgi:hypothetical protein
MTINNGLGTTLPCCDSSMSLWDQIWSNSCQYCMDSTIVANQALMQNPNNQGNTSGVPCCDPNAGYLANLFDNSCNVCNPIGEAIGLPNIPSWAWLGGLGIIGFLALKK